MDVKEKDHPDSKDPRKWTVASSYRPMTCRPTKQIMGEIYYSLVSYELFHEEQKKMPRKMMTNRYSTEH